MRGLQGAGFAGPQPARVHQGEERGCLPSPRRAGVQRRRRGEERFDLLAAQQVGARGNERGFPPVRQHAGVVMAGGLQPPAEVADVRHPRPVPARAFQPGCHPAFDGALIKDGPAVLGAPGVELLQVPDTRRAVAAHVLLECQVGLQVSGERAGEPSGRSSPGSCGNWQHALQQALPVSAHVHAGRVLAAWPRTDEIVGSGTAARSSRVAALCRRNRVPAFTSATPAAANVADITWCTEA